MNAGARRSLSSVLLGTACLVVTSCGQQQTCVDVKVGDRLLITVGEQFDPDPYTAGWEPETCQEAFGIYAGMELAVTIDGSGTGETCSPAQGLLEGLEELSLSREGALIVTGDALLRENNRYSMLSGCSGYAQFVIDSDAIPTPPRIGTRRPPGVITFAFWPAGKVDDCPSSCAVEFTAQVRVE